MAERPVRLQLSRRKGFDLQALSLATNGLPAVNVARPSKLGNPFTMRQAVEAGFIKRPNEPFASLFLVECFPRVAGFARAGAQVVVRGEKPPRMAGHPRWHPGTGRP